MRVFFILLWMQSQKITNTYDFVCPRDSHWHIRAQTKKCTDPNRYHCFEDLQQNGQMVEKCYKPELSRFGFRAVWGNNLDFKLCNEGTYMPYSAQSTLVGECLFKKSTCSEEGQVILHDRSLESDAFCMCDYTQGYAFVQTPKNRCYCVPSTEDCSCYKKPCRGDEVLSQDYNCTRLTEPLLGKVCQNSISKSIKVTVKESYPFLISETDHYQMESRNLFKKSVFTMWSLIGTIILLLMFLFGALRSYKKQGLFKLNSRMKNFSIVCYLQAEQLHIEPKYPRILDMCFIRTDDSLSLIYIDADNNNIIRKPVMGKGKRDSKHISNTNNVNRLTFVNDETVAITYKKQFEIILCNVADLEICFEVKVENFHYGIQGIVCISPANSQSHEFIISDKSTLYKVGGVEIKSEKGKNVKNDVKKAIKFSEELNFDTARRFAVSDDRNLLFVADEDNKQIIVLKTKLGTKTSVPKSHNRGLQNVRCIAVTEKSIYAATSAGVSVFRHKNGELSEEQNQYEMLISYTEHVEHTRSLCIRRFDNRMYLALSFVKDGKDEIAIFSFDSNEELT